MTKTTMHHRSDIYSKYWMEYCKKNSIKYEVVDTFYNNIIKNIEGYGTFLWHHHHAQGWIFESLLKELDVS